MLMQLTLYLYLERLYTMESHIGEEDREKKRQRERRERCRSELGVWGTRGTEEKSQREGVHRQENRVTVTVIITQGTQPCLSVFFFSKRSVSRSRAAGINLLKK